MPPSWCKGSPTRQRGGFAPLPDYVGSSAATPGSSMRPSAGQKAGRRPADLRLRETPDYHVEDGRACRRVAGSPF
jgi:hypothetical protein